MGRHGLGMKQKNWAMKIGHADALKKLGAFWRNIVKVRARYPEKRIQTDAYDHAPFWRRVNTKNTMTFKAEPVEKSAAQPTKTYPLYPSLLSLPPFKPTTNKGETE